MRKSLMAAGLAALLLTGCSDAGDPDVEQPIPPAEDSSSAAPNGTSGERARDALGEAGDAARETIQNLGEASKAGIEALQENAPDIRENLNAAGERVRNAADALVEDPDRPDVPGDSEADANETPERLEPAQ
ncbi:MAG: hypothetical protein M3453_00350 [Pseudomonadota bacterium]|nr:hypothetical protein [Pseudomonadota bacterium]